MRHLYLTCDHVDDDRSYNDNCNEEEKLHFRKNYLENNKELKISPMKQNDWKIQKHNN